MPETTPNQPNSNPSEYDPAQAALQWMQQQLAEQGIDVSPDEANAIDRLQFYHHLMKRTDIPDTHEAP